MKNKRILFVTQMFPYPLDSGAKVRAYYMLRHLAQHHHVTLVSLVRETDPKGAADHLAEFCEDVRSVVLRRSSLREVSSGLESFLTGHPALILRDRHPAFRTQLETLTRDSRFDAIHVDQIKTAQHVEGVGGLPRLIDMHNVYCEMIAGMARLVRSPWRRRLLGREARLMARYESRVCGEFDEILAVTKTNARQLSKMIRWQRPVATLPICVDVAETAIMAPTAESCDLLCVGAMFYPPNVDGVLWFLREVLPLIRREAPDARLRIVGPRPDRAIVRAAAKDPLVSVAGHVEDLGPHWRAARVSVVPLRAGSGMRVKILDAMARGVPVVSTRLGAEGINATDGEDIFLADDAGEFARAVVRLHRDRELRAKLAQNARRLIETQYDWRRRYGEVDAIYERLFAAGGSKK